jgi:integrase
MAKARTPATAQPLELIMKTIPVTEGDIPALIRSVNALVSIMDRAMRVGLLKLETHEVGDGNAVIITGDQKPVTMSECRKLMITAKENANRSKNYIKPLRIGVTGFEKGRENVPVASISVEDIERYLDKFKNPLTRKTYRSFLSVFFAFCVRKGYRKDNPIQRIETVSIEPTVPMILTPGQVEALLAACPPNIKPYFILATWVGMRPEEIVSLKLKGKPGHILDWSAIDLSEKVVKVETSKVRRRRLVPLEPKAIALLKPFAKASGPVAPSHPVVRRWHKKAREILGLKRFPADLLRHTACSYLVALKKDVAAVALTLGNSANIIMTFYREIVTDADCKAFWKI